MKSQNSNKQCFCSTVGNSFPTLLNAASYLSVLPCCETDLCVSCRAHTASQAACIFVHWLPPTQSGISMFFWGFKMAFLHSIHLHRVCVCANFDIFFERERFSILFYRIQSTCLFTTPKQDPSTLMRVRGI